MQYKLLVLRKFSAQFLIEYPITSSKEEVEQNIKLTIQYLSSWTATPAEFAGFLLIDSAGVVTRYDTEGKLTLTLEAKC